MTRGGKREGAGRPRADGGEKRTVQIPVRVTHSEMDTLKKGAAFANVPLSRFVRGRLGLRK